MGSQIVEVLRQGVWASLTGGWFYDPRHTIFCNTFHLYLFLFLLSFPLALHIFLKFNGVVGLLYCLVILAVFAILKYGVWYLHHVFDTHECVEDTSEQIAAGTTADVTKDPELNEAFELSTLRPHHSPPRRLSQNPASATSRFLSISLLSEPEAVVGKATVTPVDSLSLENDDETFQCTVGESGPSKLTLRDGILEESSTIDLKVDVHRHNSSNSSSGSSAGAAGSRSPLLLHDDHVPRALVRKSVLKFRKTKLSDDFPPEPAQRSATLPSNGTTLTLSGAVGDPGDAASASAFLHQSKSHTGIVREMLAVKTGMGGPESASPSRSLGARKSSAPALSLLSDSLEGTSHHPISDVHGDSRRHLLSVRRTRSYLDPQAPRELREELEVASSSLLAGTNDWNNSEQLKRNVKSYPGKSSSADIFLHASLMPRGKYSEASLQSDSAQGNEAESSDISIHCPSSQDYFASESTLSKVVAEVSDNRENSSSPTLTECTTIAVADEEPVRKELDDKQGPSKKHSGRGSLDSAVDSSHLAQHSLAVPWQNDNKPSKPGRKRIGSDVTFASAQDAHPIGPSYSQSTPTIEHSVGEIPRSRSDGYGERSQNSKRRLILSLRQKLQTLRSESAAVLTEEQREHSNSQDLHGGEKNDDVKKVESSSKNERRSRSSSGSPDPNVQWLFDEIYKDDFPKKRASGSKGDAAGPVISASEHKRTQSLDEHENERGTVANLHCRTVKAHSSDSNKLKEDIKRLLEEIIDFHPEATMEAIESVRQSRLGHLYSFEDQFLGPSTSTGVGTRLVRKTEPEALNERSRLRSHGRPPGSTVLAEAGRELSAVIQRPLRQFYAEHSALPAPVGARRASGNPSTTSAADLLNKPGSHLATSHDDTSNGAVHCFQDEEGTWWTYTFDEMGAVPAQPIGNSRLVTEMISAQTSAQSQAGFSPAGVSGPRRHSRRRSSSPDDWNLLEEMPVSVIHAAGAQEPALRLSDLRDPSTRRHSHRIPMPFSFVREDTHSANIREANQSITPGDYSTFTGSSSRYPVISGSLNTSSLGSASSINRIRFLTAISSGATEDYANNNVKKIKQRRYYKIELGSFFKSKKHFKICFDRLQLMALFDKNRFYSSAIFDVFMAVLVSAVSSIILVGEFYRDIWLILFCFCIAMAQFSLLKSVQPDASSPIHGYNWVVSYSRPFYFCLYSGVFLLLNEVSKYGTLGIFEMYSFKLNWQYAAAWIRDVLFGIILFLPLMATIGVLPQVNTWLMHVLEKLELFLGGTAAFSLLSAVYCLGRSICVTLLLSALCYASLLIPKPSQSILFALYCACLVCASYLLSRSSSQPRLLRHWLRYMYDMVDASSSKSRASANETADTCDPLPEKYRNTIHLRLMADLLTTLILAVLVFAMHCSTLFTASSLGLVHDIIMYLTCAVGIITHYIIPKSRSQHPWGLVAKPFLRPHEYGLYDVNTMAMIVWFEKAFVWLNFLERNVFYPLVIIRAVTFSTDAMLAKFGELCTAFMLTIGGLKLLRTSYCNPSEMNIPLLASILLFSVDKPAFSEKPLLDFFCLAVLYPVLKEFLLKLQFVACYVAPWQITWGSAFHAFAQPFSVPHSAVLIAQSFVSSILSAPLNPFLGSALFIISYVRPIKFWEKDYNTKRVDNSNTRLITQIDRSPAADDNNLNSIFYEHLTRSLQHSLAGDLMLGRWATTIAPGDCFILASSNLNCLVHLIEIGNGFVTFQLRGLEFRGTYCQQREVEAISEDIVDNNSAFCCEVGHIPGFLSLNTAWSLRWLAWEVTQSKYILQAYSVSDHSATTLCQVYELRRLLVSLYVKCILYYVITSPKLEEWLSCEFICAGLIQDKTYCDVDHLFNPNIDEDYDIRHSGVSLASFKASGFGSWFHFCAARCRPGSQQNPLLLSLCFGMSIVGRRLLGTAAQNRHNSVESFLYGLHALFKGDFRITCSRDEWVFGDMDLLSCVIAPAIRMALKLHQDHFTELDDTEEHAGLYEAISNNERNLFISHEADPGWRQAILRGCDSLLALRHVFDDGNDEYKIIMLTKRFLNFRVIKLNRECVRGLWAGQQQELIFLRNRNPERGSIQNARQVLRNMINSSADQPVGYPIYVSPLTTSFTETNSQLASVIGGPVTFGIIANFVTGVLRRLGERLQNGSASVSLGSRPRRPPPLSQGADEATTSIPMQVFSIAPPSVQFDPSPVDSVTPPPRVQRSFTHPSGRRSHFGGSGGSDTASYTGPRSSVISTTEETRSNSARVSLGALFTSNNSKDSIVRRVRILNPTAVLETLNMPRNHGGQMLVIFPDESMRTKAGRNFWKDFEIKKSLEGSVVHAWTPFNLDPAKRSHLDKTILLLQIDDKYVPVLETGVETIGDEV